MTKFQLIFTGIFGVFIIAGVIIFATFKGSGGVADSHIVIWGTIPSDKMSRIIAKSGIDKTITVNYEEKKEETFDKVLTEALAEGKGPDIFFLRDDNIIQHRNKVYVIPFENYPKLNFQNTFIDGTDIYLRPDGVAAIPFTLDPLVMYWNRDTFQNAGLLNPPVYWDEFFALTEVLTEKELLDIKKSAIALGTYANVNNAKQILSTLLLQAGSPIISRIDGEIKPTLAVGDTEQLENALKFYTEFSNPVKNFYSWNTSLPDSKEVFLKGDLAVYIGLASEYDELQKRNPNLRIGVSEIPQIRGAKNLAVYAKMNALAISKTSKNIKAAYQVATLLVGDDSSKASIEFLGLPSMKRSFIGAVPNNPVLTVYNKSAVYSKAWFDPNKDATNRIFKSMTESVTSGRLDTRNALLQARSEIEFLMANI